MAEAISSFNDMSAQIENSRERLLYFTRLESWQTLGRKMAHEVKNSLTPIRLTVEEMVARSHPSERLFLDQASQIVTDEVQSLERRVRAFSELSSEPPLRLEALDVNALAEDRIAFLTFAEALASTGWADARSYLEKGPSLLANIQHMQRVARAIGVAVEIGQATHNVAVDPVQPECACVTAFSLAVIAFRSEVIARPEKVAGLRGFQFQ